MDCNKTKSLLSEYLDRTLQNDLNRDVKEHLLSCKDCSNEFFLMKSITRELSGLERIKAPNYLLHRVNQAVTSPSWLSKILDFIPGSGGFKVPMEFVTLTTTVALIFLIIANINVDKNENIMVADSGRHETSINSDSNRAVRLDFIPEANIKSGSSSSENVVYGSSGQPSGNIDPFDMLKKNMPAVPLESLISDLTERLHMAGGYIASKEYALDSGNIDAITVKIPLNSYNSFIRKAEKIGRFDPPAPQLSHQSPDPVLLRIRLNLSE